MDISGILSMTSYLLRIEISTVFIFTMKFIIFALIAGIAFVSAYPDGEFSGKIYISTSSLKVRFAH